MSELVAERPSYGIAAATKGPALGGFGRAVQNPFANESKATSDRIRELESLANGWAGPGTLAPSTETLATALQFNACLWSWRAMPKVGPGHEGQIVFEWDLPSGHSLYCHVLGKAVEMVGFDSKSDTLDVTLPAEPAAQVAKVLLEYL